jgi:hypothetical protein
MRHKYLTNVLTFDECDEIYNAFMKIKKRQKGVYNFKEALQFTDKILDRIKEFGDLKFADTYTTTYLNNDFLFPHIDQERYDVTVSININGLQDCQIHCSNVPYVKIETDKETRIDWSPYVEDYSSYAIAKGDGLVCLGRQYVHWRNKLVAGKNESVTQTMFHFTFNSY